MLHFYGNDTNEKFTQCIESNKKFIDGCSKYTDQSAGLIDRDGLLCAECMTDYDSIQTYPITILGNKSWLKMCLPKGRWLIPSATICTSFEQPTANSLYLKCKQCSDTNSQDLKPPCYPSTDPLVTRFSASSSADCVGIP